MAKFYLAGEAKQVGWVCFDRAPFFLSFFFGGIRGAAAASPYLSAPIASAQVERDVMVWNNKMYRKNPILVKEDKLIAQHRKWYQQFYSENSPTYESIKAGDLSW